MVLSSSTRYGADVLQCQSQDWVNDKVHSVMRMRYITVLVYILSISLSLVIVDMSYLLGMCICVSSVLMIGISGSIASSFLAFILPGLIYFTVKPNPSFKRWVGTIASIAFGVVIVVVGLYTTLYFQ